MQGSYKNQGLPRPYYMKPTAMKKNSPYNKAPQSFFSTPRRKVLGYIVLIFLFGTCMYLISQDIKTQPDPVYTVVKPDASINLDKMVISAKDADKEADKVGLAGNLAQGSKGEIGMGVAEAPKGGIANEAPVVGNDKNDVVDGGQGGKPLKRGGVQAIKEV
ncbi:hypothetical protein CAAN1_10S01948 [[Candida] anglica]|uniref:Uncharacterized protein n=1 Tax=[Candida] anglica TaxID=148631 RepID=A0ABP0EHX0_9ASCO